MILTKQSDMNSSSASSLKCKKHGNRFIRFICSVEDCQFGNLICETCLNSDPRHYQSHKSFISETNQFMSTQTKVTNKLMPSIAETIGDIEKTFTEYANFADQEANEIDKDFGVIFKQFFTISEQAKGFLKEQLKGEGMKIGPKLLALKTRMQEQSQVKRKDGNGVFGILFPRDQHEEVSAGSEEELVTKLIKKNAPLNQIRADAFALSQELTACKNKRITYKRSDQSQSLFVSIKDSFEQACKEMYRKFKVLLEGTGEDEMRKSVFQGMKSSTTSLSNSIILNKQRPPVISIDLSDSQRVIQNNFSSESEKKPTRVLKKVNQFPNFTNKNVLEAIRINGSFNLRIDNSYFNNQPEQGPFEIEDGSIYYGHIVDQKRQGRGKAMFPDGAYYEGFWKDDIPYGMGRIIRSNGDLYQGQCINFKAQGKGVFKTLKGEYLYNGEWQDDLKHGQGEEVMPLKYQYIGEFAYGKKHGAGEIKFTDGTVYSGHFQEGEMTGEGTFTYVNNEKYAGQVKEGQKYGKGCYIWPDGRSYDGQYMNDLPHGQGIFMWPDGYIYNGSWLNGLQHGSGTEIDPEGMERKGEWENGKWKCWV